VKNIDDERFFSKFSKNFFGHGQLAIKKPIINEFLMAKKIFREFAQIRVLLCNFKKVLTKCSIINYIMPPYLLRS
jgi:hypothetical protein